MSSGFEYSRRDAIVVALAAGIIVALLGVGFGLASAKPIEVVDPALGENVTEPCLPKSSFELALEILDENPVLDGYVSLRILGLSRFHSLDKFISGIMISRWLFGICCKMTSGGWISTLTSRRSSLSPPTR